MMRKVYVFGDNTEYRLDARLPELRNGGQLVASDPAPLRILAHLIEHPNQFFGVEIFPVIFGVGNVAPETFRGHMHKVYQALGGTQKARQLVSNDRHGRYAFISHVEEYDDNSAIHDTSEPAKSRSRNLALPRLDETQLRPFLIEEPRQPEFEQFLALYHDAFDEEVRDPDEDLERWLREAEKFVNDDPPCHDWFLVAKFPPSYNLSKEIAGLVYASNYPSLQYLFVSYIVSNEALAERLFSVREFDPASEIRTRAIRCLLLTLAANTQWERGVISEIEKKDQKKNRLLRSRFRHYASAFFDRPLYQIKIDYKQPSLEAAQMKIMEDQDLLFMPGSEFQTRIEAGGGTLHRDDVSDILRFVYMNVYAGNFDKKYWSYIHNIFLEVSASLPVRVDLERISR